MNLIFLFFSFNYFMWNLLQTTSENIYFMNIERPVVERFNSYILKNLTVTSRRISHMDPRHYVNVFIHSVRSVDNKLKMDIQFYQFLTNRYRPSFVEFHMGFCDLLDKDGLIGSEVKKHAIKLNVTCPYPAGEYHLTNMSIPTIPKNFPFNKGRIYINASYMVNSKNINIGQSGFTGARASLTLHGHHNSYLCSKRANSYFLRMLILSPKQAKNAMYPIVFEYAGPILMEIGVGIVQGPGNDILCIDLPRERSRALKVLSKDVSRTHPQWPYQLKRTIHQKSDFMHHLICFKDWDSEMVLKVIFKAYNLKCWVRDTHGKNLNLLKNLRVMILEDHDEPILRMAVSKAAALMGATDVHITETINWDDYYNAKVFSEMADIIFVSTTTHGCMRRFASLSAVPIMCMRTRKHASLQALSTFMSIIEDYGTLRTLNIAYVGPPHQTLNDYLLLCPMLGANLRFKCCCKTCPVSPLLKKDAENLCELSSTVAVQLTETKETLRNAHIVIAGPTTKKTEKIREFELSVEAIQNSADHPCWTFYHTFPRGKEVNDDLFWHQSAKTFNAFKNTQYIAAALMMTACKSYIH